MHRKSHLFAVVLLLISVGSAAEAQGGPRRGMPGGLLRLFTNARIQARLNLTPEQQKHIREIVKAHRAAAPQTGATPRVNAAQERQALMQAIFSDKPDQAEIDKRMTALSQQHAAAVTQNQQQLSRGVAAMLEINQVLTPEQRAEMKKILGENARTGEIMRHRMMRRVSPPQPQTAPPPQE